MNLPALIRQIEAGGESAIGGILRTYCVYIMTNRKQGVLYTGVTNNIERRVHEHKQKLISGFTRRYNLTKLVYYEHTSDVRSAIAREKQIKGLLRAKKIKLIEGMNPGWEDLSNIWYDSV